jgi:enhancer of polycomb-like protein
VSYLRDDVVYERIYPADFKLPRQLIHVQRKYSALPTAFLHALLYDCVSSSSLLALSLEQDIPDYDMDSSDELWVESKTDLTPYKFEQMMDRLEKITVCSLDDAKALVKRNEVNQDVFDYWVSKRLKTVSAFALRVSDI